jgi:hypothetical protein
VKLRFHWGNSAKVVGSEVDSVVAIVYGEGPFLSSAEPAESTVRTDGFKERVSESRRDFGGSRGRLLPLFPSARIELS